MNHFITAPTLSQTISLRRWRYITIATVLSILLSSPVTLLRYHLGDDTAGYTDDNLTREILLVLVLGPPLETLIFFSFPYWLHQKLDFKLRWFVIISSVAFGLSHGYSFLYIVDTFITGVFWCGVYLFSIQRQESAFVNVALVHSLLNLIISALQYLA